MEKTDQEIIVNINNGKQDQFKELVFRYQKLILNMSYNYTRNWEDAQDLSQEIFIKIYKGLDSFHFKSSFKTWLYRIAMNTLYTYKKKNRLQETVISDEHNAIQDQSTIASPEKSYNKKILQSKVYSAIHAISSKKEQMAMLLRFSEELSIKEIAGIMDLKEGTIKTLLHRGIKKVQKTLSNNKELLYEN